VIFDVVRVRELFSYITLFMNTNCLFMNSSFVRSWLWLPPGWSVHELLLFMNSSFMFVRPAPTVNTTHCEIVILCSRAEHLEHLECGRQPLFRDARLRSCPLATDGTV
jgi:hypothetical protein